MLSGWTSSRRGPPHPDATGAAGDVADLHRSVGGQLPVEVVEVEFAVRADLEPVGAGAGDRPVAADAARFVEHERVGDGADALVHLAGGQAVEQRERTGTADLKALERGHVVQRDRLPGAPRLGGRDRRVGPCGPGVSVRRGPLRGELGHQRGVGLVPLRSFPSGVIEEDGAELLLADVEGADADVARGGPRLQRVQHVVDLHEVLRGRLFHVARRALEVGEAVHVAAVQVVLRPAVDQELGDGLGDARGVGHPDGLGDPEARDLGGLADQRSAVRGEREDSVEALLDLCRAQGGQQSLAVVPGFAEVVLGEMRPRVGAEPPMRRRRFPSAAPRR